MKHTVSKEHRLYLKRGRRKSLFIGTVRLGLLLLLVGLWELVTALGWADPFLVSSPSRILQTIASLYTEGTLFYHIGVTLSETILGFLAAVLFGCVIALLLWWSETLRRVLEPYIVVLNALPKIALGPLIIIWCGTGSKAIVFMTVLVTIILVILHMLSAFLSADEGKILLLKSMGAGKALILLKLVIPSSLPAFVSMLKVAVGMSWIGSIMGEYIVSRAGLGYLIVYGGQVFKTDLVMAATVTLCALAALMYGAVALAERLYTRSKNKRRAPDKI